MVDIFFVDEQTTFKDLVLRCASQISQYITFEEGEREKFILRDMYTGHLEYNKNILTYNLDEMNKRSDEEWQKAYELEYEKTSKYLIKLGQKRKNLEKLIKQTESWQIPSSNYKLLKQDILKSLNAELVNIGILESAFTLPKIEIWKPNQIEQTKKALDFFSNCLESNEDKEKDKHNWAKILMESFSEHRPDTQD